MANPRINGVVNKAARNGKSFTLDGHYDDNNEEIWYSAFSADQVGEISRGAEVEFECKQNNKNGRTFYNIQKNVRVHNPGNGGAVTAPATSGGDGLTRAAPKPGAIPIDRERCIVRQNSVNVAAQVMQSMVFSENVSAEDMVQTLLYVANEIEAHTSGDADAAAALAEVMGETSSEDEEEQSETKIKY